MKELLTNSTTTSHNLNYMMSTVEPILKMFRLCLCCLDFPIVNSMQNSVKHKYNTGNDMYTIIQEK